MCFYLRDYFYYAYFLATRCVSGLFTRPPTPTAEPSESSPLQPDATDEEKYYWEGFKRVMKADRRIEATRYDLGRALRFIGEHPTKEQLNQLILNTPTTHDGWITFAEFLRLVEQHQTGQN